VSVEVDAERAMHNKKKALRRIENSFQRLKEYARERVMHKAKSMIPDSVVEEVQGEYLVQKLYPSLLEESAIRELQSYINEEMAK